MDLVLVDRIIVMNEGKIVMDGPRDQILSQSNNQTHPSSGAQ